MKLILFGPPGAGKGTCAQLLSNKYFLEHISTGDMLRNAIQQGSELGLMAKEKMDKGELVPDNIVIGLIKEAITSEKCKSGYILDGFPRTIPQAESLDTLFQELGVKPDKVINMEIDTSVVIDRLSARRTCKQCGALFNLKRDKLTGNDCPKCGTKGSIFQRDDDKEETIKNRFKVYNEVTAPIKEYYKSKGLLIDVDSKGTPDEVFSRMVNTIEN